MNSTIFQVYTFVWFHKIYWHGTQLISVGSNMKNEKKFRPHNHMFALMNCKSCCQYVGHQVLVSVGRQSYLTLSRVGTWDIFCSKSLFVEVLLQFKWGTCIQWLEINHRIIMSFCLYTDLDTMRGLLSRTLGGGSRMLLRWGALFGAWGESLLPFFFFLGKEDSCYHNIACWKCLTCHISLPTRTSNERPGTTNTWKDMLEEKACHLFVLQHAFIFLELLTLVMKNLSLLIIMSMLSCTTWKA